MARTSSKASENAKATKKSSVKSTTKSKIEAGSDSCRGRKCSKSSTTKSCS